MSAPVPDVLLSLAKDDRYISEVSSLLSQVAVPLASIFLLRRRSRGDGARTSRGGASPSADRRGENDDEILEDDGKRFVDRIRPELNLLASLIVHSATFIFYTRNFGAISESDGKSIKRSLGMESLNLAYRYPVKKSAAPSSATTTLMKHRRAGRLKHLSDHFLRVVSSCTPSSWTRLLFLQTVVPYMIQRVGRGGWSKDLGSLSSALLDMFGLGPASSRAISSNNRSENELMREEDINAIRNDDRLRGSARRRLFDEQRRRMLSASSSNIDSESSERPVRALTNGVGNESSTLTSPGNGAFGRRLQRMSSLSWDAISKMYLAISSMSHGAHSLPRHTGLTANENLDRYAKAIKWFLRLHLALFYWNGMYPTVAHRLAGAKIRDDVAPYTAGTTHISGTIVANRPSYKPMAAIILIQAAAALAQSTAEASIEAAHFFQVAFFRWRRRRRMQQHEQRNGGSAVNGHGMAYDRTNSERAEYMDLIEERVPGIDSAEEVRKSRSKKSRRNGNGQTGQPCGICLNERVHPAAPSVCGHVFCWKCILHWVSNVRAECPLCRGHTRPQDIIPLYN